VAAGTFSQGARNMEILVPAITVAAVVFAIIVVWTLITLAFAPSYAVYKQRLKGQADLAQAEAESRVRVLNAHANLDAAKLDAQADVERAKGIALSIKEVESSLGGPEGYLRWKYIHMLEEGTCDNQIIYIPTEAGLPILEAGRAPKIK
jgi:hypothetical protein